MGCFFEGYVDVVEDFNVVAEEADRLHDYACVAFVFDGFEGVFYSGADPGAAADALALEGEEPVFFGEAYYGEPVGYELCGSLGFDGVGVGRHLHGRAGAGACDGGFACHDGAAGDAVRGEEHRDAGSGLGAGFGPYGPELVGEGLGQERVLGPSGYELDLKTGGCGEERSAIETYAGAGVLWGEADGFDVGDAVYSHLGYYVGDVGVPVAHRDVDAGAVESLLE